MTDLPVAAFWLVPLLAMPVVFAAAYLGWLRRVPEIGTPPAPPDLPAIDVVVAVHDEAHWIADKLANLAALDYPRQLLHVWIADGGSTDGTRARVREWIAGRRGFTLLSCGVADKTAQLNAALARGAAPWVLVTDADTRLGPDTLERLVAVTGGGGVAVAGTSARPLRAHAVEDLHWRVANRLREIEGRRGAASIVTAPCYLFRRDLIDAFPPAVVADDAYVAMRACARGQRVLNVAADVRELRSPRGLAQLFAHKLRKCDAYLREVVRFVPLAARMGAAGRGVFLWRAIQLALVPVVVLAGVPAAFAAGESGGWPVLALFGALLGAGPALLVVALGLRDRAAIAWSLPMAALLVAVLCVACLRLPFTRQSARFPKVAVTGAFRETVREGDG